MSHGEGRFVAPDDVLLALERQGRIAAQYVDEKGDAYLTDAGVAWTKDKGNFSGFVLPIGESLKQWNVPWVMNTGENSSYGDGNGGRRIISTTEWSDSQALIASNPVFDQWRETTGYHSWMDWLNAEDAFISDSILSNLPNLPSPDQDQQRVLSALAETVINASWQMVYASSDAEFDRLWTTMTQDCFALGAVGIQHWRVDEIRKVQSSLGVIPSRYRL
jgi:hypothetical protein